MSQDRKNAWKRARREVTKEIHESLEDELELNVASQNSSVLADDACQASSSVSTSFSEALLENNSSACPISHAIGSEIDPPDNRLFQEPENELASVLVPGAEQKGVDRPMFSDEDEMFDVSEEFEYEYIDNVDLEMMRLKLDADAQTEKLSPEDAELLKSLFEDDAEVEEPDGVLKADLVVWSLENKIGRNALTDLLHVLRNNNHPNLPKSSKTLMKTPRSTVNLFKKLEDGIFWYYGILNGLRSVLTPTLIAGLLGIVLYIDLFIDGVSPYKSVKEVLWPICGCIVGTQNIFIIAMWCGSRKEPSDQNFFFDDLIKEAEILMQGFSYNGVQLKLGIRNIIADAPARTWIKNVNQHGSYSACERCTAVGQWIGNRMTYHPREETEPRTDQSLAEHRDKNYHKGDCALLRLNINLISQIPLEPMHLLYLGVMKRIMTQLLGTRKNTCQYKFSDGLKGVIDSLSLYLSKFYPAEFARRPRAWTDFSLFKATEFRRILLYDGFILLKCEGVSKKVYSNFLLFACAIRILSDPHLVKEFADDADLLLNEFIVDSVRVYKQIFNVYNVHHLKHLSAECKRHGHLESFSAFMYECFLGILKRLLHAPGRTLSQIVCRLMEQIAHMPPTSNETEGDDIQVSMSCNLPLSLRHLGQGFEKISIPKKKIQLTKDSIFLSTEKEVVMISNIIKTTDSYLVAGNVFREKTNYFVWPVPSSSVGIHEVNQPSETTQIWTVNQIFKKCIVVPIPSVNSRPQTYFEGPCISLTMLHGE